MRVGAESLVFGVRPGHVSDPSIMDEVPGETTFDALVRAVEPMGSYRPVTMVPAGMEEAGEGAEFTGRIANDSDAAVGDTVTLAVEMGKTHVFDGETGENLTL